jgi:hypothetical protein
VSAEAPAMMGTRAADLFFSRWDSIGNILTNSIISKQGNSSATCMEQAILNK